MRFRTVITVGACVHQGLFGTSARSGEESRQSDVADRRLGSKGRGCCKESSMAAAKIGIPPKPEEKTTWPGDAHRDRLQAPGASPPSYQKPCPSKARVIPSVWRPSSQPDARTGSKIQPPARANGPFSSTARAAGPHRRTENTLTSRHTGPSWLSSFGRLLFWPRTSRCRCARIRVPSVELPVRSGACIVGSGYPPDQDSRFRAYGPS